MTWPNHQVLRGWRNPNEDSDKWPGPIEFPGWQIDAIGEQEITDACRQLRCSWREVIEIAI